jgi:hypothetical protein
MKAKTTYRLLRMVGAFLISIIILDYIAYRLKIKNLKNNNLYKNTSYDIDMFSVINEEEKNIKKKTK